MDRAFWESMRSATDLMGAAFVEPPSPAIAAILDALSGAEPTQEQRRIWRDISPQKWPARRRRRAAIAVGRRGLKTTGVLAWQAVHEVLRPELDERALAGSRIYALIVAPRLPQAREATRGVRAALDALSSLGLTYEVRDAAGSPEIVLRTPWLQTERVISVCASDAVATRGFAICFCGVDEAAFLGSDPHLAQVDTDLLRAVSAAMAQFEDPERPPILLLTSSCGAPQGQFHAWVTKPSADTLVVRAPTWVTNSRISRDDCLRIAGNDVHAFRQEFESSQWGYAGEHFLSASDVRGCHDERAGQGPQSGGSYAVGLDVAQVHDRSGIVCCSGYIVPVKPGDASLRGITVEHVEAIASSRRDPPSLEMIVGRAVAVSKRYGHAPILFDMHSGPTVRELLEEAGYRDAESRERLRPRRYLQVGMSPTQQTPRWLLVRQLVLGRRLRLHPADHAELARELCGLHAVQQAAGTLKIDGRQDDLADALALAAEAAITLPATGEGAFRHTHDGITFTDGQIEFRNERWETVVGGRRVVSRVPPEGSGRAFDRWCERMIQQGITCPEIQRWQAKRAELDARRPDAARPPVSQWFRVGGVFELPRV